MRRGECPNGIAFNRGGSRHWPADRRGSLGATSKVTDVRLQRAEADLARSRNEFGFFWHKADLPASLHGGLLFDPRRSLSRGPIRHFTLAIRPGSGWCWDRRPGAKEAVSVERFLHRHPPIWCVYKGGNNRSLLGACSGRGFRRQCDPGFRAENRSTRGQCGTRAYFSLS